MTRVQKLILLRADDYWSEKLRDKSERTAGKSMPQNAQRFM